MSDQIETLLQNTTRILDKLSQAPAPARQVDQSESVGSLAAALAQAQGKFTNPERNKTAKVRGKSRDGSPIEYSYRYADLADILTVIRSPLSEAGLSYSQDVRFDKANDEAVVVTTLRHSSGEWVRTVLKYPSAAGRIQDLGSIFTYLRRYSLSALIGIAPEDDDDGELAVDAARTRREDRAQAAQDKRARSEAKNAKDGPPTDEEFARFRAKFEELAKDRFASQAEAFAWLKDQEPNPAQAYTKRLSAILGTLGKKPVLGGADQAEGQKADQAPEDPKRRGAAQQRWHLLFGQKGLSVEEASWWAGRQHNWQHDPEKDRPSAKLTPLPQVLAAITELSKLGTEAIDGIKQSHAEHLEDLRIANEEAEKMKAEMAEGGSDE